MNQIETQDELSSLTGERRLVDIWRREIDNAKKYHEKSKAVAKEYDKFYNFVKGGNDGLSSMRRETMFINTLQGLHPLEAEIVSDNGNGYWLGRS